MAWEAYVLTYRAMTPIALGAYRFGFIQRTRYYAPGWTLWGAITAQLTRAIFPKATGKTYQEVGSFVRKNLPTSWAYILTDEKPACPQYEEGQLCYGSLSAAEFEARFLASCGQTAVAPGSLTAHSGTLHETEALAAYERDGKPVRWQFTLYMRKPWTNPPRCPHDLTEERIVESLKYLSIGGDRRYGLGRLQQEEAPVLQEAGERDRPVPSEWHPKSRVLRAHMPFEDVPGEMVQGRLEAIPWRWWQNKPGGAWGPGQKREVRCLYTPGSKIKEGLAGHPVVGEYGIWHWQGEKG